MKFNKLIKKVFHIIRKHKIKSGFLLSCILLILLHKKYNILNIEFLFKILQKLLMNYLYY